MAVTRIKNNQITDSTITYQKIANGTLVGSLFNPNLTFNSNINIVGNLQVSGNTTTIQSIDTLVNDPLVIFNNGYGGTPSYDVGILVNRALGSLASYGGVNAALVWSESDGAFIAVLTTETGTTYGRINRKFQANLIVGNLTVSNAISIGTSLTAGSAAFSSINGTPIGNATPAGGWFTTLQAGTGFSTANAVISGGYISALSNITVTTGNTSSWYATTLNTTTANITSGAAGTLFVTNFNTGNAVITGGYVNGLANLTVTTAQFTNLSTGNAVISGGYLSGLANITTTTGNAQNWTTTVLNASAANISGPLYASSINTANAVITGGYINNMANVTGTLSNFTNSVTGTAVATNFSSGNIYFTGTTTGTVSTANVSLYQQLTNSTTDASFYPSFYDKATGNALAYTNTSLTFNPSTGYLTATRFVGDVYSTTGRFTNLSTGNAVISGGYLSGLANITATTGNVGSWYAATINATNANITGALALGSLNTANAVITGGYINNLANLTATTTQTTNFSTANALVTGGVLNNINVQANNFSTGNAVISGGYISALSNITATTGNVGSWYTATLNATNANVTGAVYAGSLNTANAVITGGYINNLANISSTTDVATNFSTGNAVISGGYISALSNITATTGNVGSWYAATLNVTNANISGPLFATSLNTANAVISGGYISALTNAYITTGRVANFSSPNVIITGGYLDNTPIGANVAAAGAFTALTASGSTTFTSSAESNNNITGAVVVSGGVGIAKNLNVGGNIHVDGNLIVAGTLTAIDSTTVKIVDLNIELAANATTAAQANGAGLTVDGAGATFTYASSDDSWNLNKQLFVPTVTTPTLNATGGNVTTLRATNFSTANAVITGGNINLFTGNYPPLSTTGYLTADKVQASDGLFGNINTGSIQAASGAITGLTNLQSSVVNTGNIFATFGNINNAFIGSVTPQDATFLTANATTVVATTGNINTINVTNANITNQKIATLVVTNFSTANAVITGGYINGLANLTATTAQFTNVSTANAVITGGYINSLSNITATTAQFTNFSTGNAWISGGNATLANAYVTTSQATNFSTGNAVITGGYIQTVANVYATTGQFTNLSTANALVTGGVYNNVNIQANNFSTANALITGGVLNNINAQANNFSTANALVTGGVLNNINVQANNISTSNAYVTNGTLNSVIIGNATAGYGKFTQLIATTSADLSPTLGSATVTINPTNIGSIDNMNIGASYQGNAYVSNFRTTQSLWASTVGTVFIRAGTPSGSSINNIAIGTTNPAEGTFTNANAQNFTSATINATNGNVTTLVATNFSSANVQISGSVVVGGNIVAGSGTTSTNTTTGALVVVGGAGVSGALNIGGQIVTTAAGSATDGAGQLYLNGATSNRIDWNTNGTGSPAFTTRSAGTKLTLYPAITGSQVDYAIGIDSATVWTSVPSNDPSFNFKWYGATTQVASLGGTGILTVAGNIVANSTTTSTSTTTGALVVQGGMGVAGNLNIGGNINSPSNIVINSVKSAATDFIVRGANENSLIYAVADTVYDQVSIGGNIVAANVVQGAKLVVSSNDALLLPVGSSSERPSGQGFTDVAGMIRYNSTISQIEYYDGGTWKATGSQFTVISDAQYADSTGDIRGNVDGVNTTFVLPSATTTNASIVSLNGVLQLPDSSYTIFSGNTSIVFTEAPSLGDVIDVRMLTTTTSIDNITSQNGFNYFEATNTSLSFYSGNVLVGSNENWRIDTNGDFYPVTASNIGAPTKRVDYLFASNIDISGGTLTGVSLGGGSLDNTVIGGNIAALGAFTTLYANSTFQANSDVIITNGNIIVDSAAGQYIAPSTTGYVDSFNKNSFRGGEFLIQLSRLDSTQFQMAKVILVHDGTTPSIETYGVTYTGAANLATFSANISGSTVYLNASSAGANLVVKTSSMLMKV
ncbi:hypothetical protein UFOVP257_10 [uncultured Caudovirales phage]|uniref:Uncharacterized protein n=1 Tax=uncultured Caudovirales phage TaxID=2100421 RepID=A0A6J5LFA2_9CAUD|nr:hypothetical protein UFOVP257_10 [uncultured Caudovirales phage]